MSEVIQKNKVKLDTLLWQVRELCRKHKLQVWGNQSLPNQIYQDLLFIYHVPALCVSGNLELDVEYIGDGKLTEVSYKSLLSLKEPTLINTAFKRLWKKLQNCVLKPLFEGREFVMFAIEKKDAKKYMTLLLDIMNYLASIELEKYDSNAGYTYFKKDLNKNVAKTFGQFYTPSSVTASVVKQVDPKTGESILDPSSGSCSFLAEAANHIAKSESVDMATAFKDLYGTEVEPNIYAEGVMNMFINFGILPDMNERIREVDALLDMAKNTMLFKKIVANPPFGANASSFLEFYYQTIIEPPTGKAKKGTKKVILNSEVKCEIPFPKISESAILFFQYIIQKLAPGGKAGVVMSATIFNDGFKDMMKWFLECCSLEKVIINPAGTFKEQGTGIETFSFIFTKGSPTTKIDIVMLGAEDVVVRSLTLDQIKEAGWKLQLKEEVKAVANPAGFPMLNLGDIAELCRNNTEIVDDVNGMYTKYFGPKIVGKCSNYHFDGEYILTPGRQSIGLLGYVNGKFTTTHTFVIKVKHEHSSKYVYYYLLLNDKLSEKSKGIIPYIKNEDVLTLQVIVPPIETQQEIVTTLDRIFTDPQDMKDCLAFTDKAMDLILKDPSGKLLEDVMGGLRLKRSHLAAATSIKSQMAAVMRSVGARGYEKKKLGDVSSMVKGNAFKSEEFLGSGFPILKVSDLENRGINTLNLVYTTENSNYNKFLVKRNDVLLVVTGSSTGKLAMNTTNMEFYLNQNSVVLRADPVVIEQKFLFYLLLSDDFQKAISNGSSGSAQPFVSCKNINEMEIPVPPLAVQQEVLAILNEMEAELNVMEQIAAKAEQRAKYILDGYLTSRSQLTAEPIEELVEPVAVPQNTLVSSTPEPAVPAEPTEPPKPAKKVFKLKKGSS